MAIKKTVVIDVETNQADKNLKKTKDNITELSNEFDKTKDKSSSAFSALDKITGGAISKLKGLKGSLGGVSLGFKSVGSAIAASGIGLLVLIIAGIIQAFKSSEAGQNKFAKLMGVIGSVVGNVTDVLSDLGEFVINLFSGDGEAIKSAEQFGKKIFDVVGLPIKNIIDIVKTASKVLGSLFSGDIEGAIDDLKNGVSDIKGNFTEAKDAINSAKDSLVEFGKEALREAEIAGQIAEARANADKIDRSLIVERAEANRKISELREKASRKDLYSLAERKKALIQASKINEDITEKEIKSAKIRRDAIIEENKLSKSNKDDLNAEEEAKAKVIDLETKRLDLQKRLGTELSSINQQQRAEADARLKAIQAETDKENKLEQDKKDKAEKKAQEDLLKAQEDERNTLQAIEDLENEFLESKLEKQQLELNAVREKYFGIIEAAREAGQETLILEEAQQSEIDAVKKKYIDIQNARDKKEKDEEKKRDQAVANAKVNIRDRTSQLIQEIAGKDTAVGKGVAVASATISGIEGVQNAYTTASKSPITTVFPAYPAIQAGLAGAFSALQIKKILSTDATGKSGGGATTSGGVGGGASQPSAPSFNLVQGTGTNQIAESIGNQNRPIQAYVVSGSVTSAQELDRNIIESSTI